MSFRIGKPEGVAEFFGDKYVKTDKRNIDEPVIIEKIFKGFDEKTDETYVAIGGNMAGARIWFYSPSYDTSGIKQIDEADIDVLTDGSYCYIVNCKESSDPNKDAYYTGYIELRESLENEGVIKT